MRVFVHAVMFHFILSVLLIFKINVCVSVIVMGKLFHFAGALVTDSPPYRCIKHVNFNEYYATDLCLWVNKFANLGFLVSFCVRYLPIWVDQCKISVASGSFCPI